MTLIGLTLGGLLGKKDGVDEGDDSTLGDGDASQKLVQLFIFADGQLNMPRVDPLLLVVPGSVTSELEDLGSEVLHDGGEVDRGSSSNTVGVATFTKKTMDPSHRELKTSTAGPGLPGGLGLDFSTVTSSGHLWIFCVVCRFCVTSLLDSCRLICCKG